MVFVQKQMQIIEFEHGMLITLAKLITITLQAFLRMQLVCMRRNACSRHKIM